MLRSKDSKSPDSDNHSLFSPSLKTAILVGLIGFVMLSVQPWRTGASDDAAQPAVGEHTVLVDARASANGSEASTNAAESPGPVALFIARFNALGETLGAE